MITGKKIVLTGANSGIGLETLKLLVLYNYLIHDTDSCRKQGKYLYKVEDRICGNGFDIGLYEQFQP